MRLVNLSPADLILAAHRAGLIRGLKALQAARGDLSNRRVAKADDFGLHYMGMLSEAAVAGVLDVPVRDDVTVFGDGAVDMVYRGQTIQVKCSSHANTKIERLIYLNDMGEFRADWLVACSVQSPSCIAIHGFISRGKFAKHSFSHDFGYGPRVCVKESALASIDDMPIAVERVAA